MSTWNMLKKKDTSVKVAVPFCQMFVMEEDEFLASSSTQANKDDPDFWIDMAEYVLCSVDGYLAANAMTNKKGELKPRSACDFMLSLDDRLEFNDILYQAIDSFLEERDCEETE